MSGTPVTSSMAMRTGRCWCRVLTQTWWQTCEHRGLAWMRLARIWGYSLEFCSDFALLTLYAWLCITCASQAQSLEETRVGVPLSGSSLGSGVDGDGVT